MNKHSTISEPTKDALELYSDDKTKETIHKESGCSFKLNIEKCYFSVRSSNERLRIAKQVKDTDSILFVGCSTGEEIIDFQSICPNIHVMFYGIDYDAETVRQANQRMYKIKPNIFTADILKEQFNECIQNETKKTSFDIVICRNLLIYYKDEPVQKIIEKLSTITKRILTIGISDPITFMIQDDIAILGKYTFKITDFENRIFEKVI